MKNYKLGLLVTALAVNFYACTNTSTNEDSKSVAEDMNEAKFDSVDIKQDLDFAITAADGGMLEVALGELSQTNAAAAGVKEFGKNMVTEHSAANEELKALAAKKNITLPGQLSDKNADRYKDMAKKKGADFDKDYISFMVDDHKKDIDNFKTEAEKGKDIDVKDWATKKVPTLEHHLQMAQELNEKLK